MKPKKKAKKAVTLLEKVETLLSDVLDQCSDFEKSAEKNAREVLLSARSSIGSAINYISASVSSEPRPAAAKKNKAKPSVKASKRAKAPAARKAVKAKKPLKQQQSVIAPARQNSPGTV